jgi:hypothetical protein
LRSGAPNCWAGHWPTRGASNPFATEPLKLKHQFDDVDMSSNDLARELAYVFTLQMQQQDADASDSRSKGDGNIRH